MEIIRGKQTSYIDALAFAHMTIGYDNIHIDIGTGDGRYVQHIAQSYPDSFVIGIDACRENLHKVSRRAPENALFVIANALNLPSQLSGLANHITINFPWGSLLTGLLDDDADLLDGLASIGHCGVVLDVLLNGGALAEAGWALEEGADRVRRVLDSHGFVMSSPVGLATHDLRTYPTTWAKRLAYGRDPRAIHVQGKRSG